MPVHWFHEVKEHVVKVWAMQVQELRQSMQLHEQQEEWEVQAQQLAAQLAIAQNSSNPLLAGQPDNMMESREFATEIQRHSSNFISPTLICSQ